ncbi:hypothetical protein [Hyalangium gracile]|uniref:hypothetical protein n=1 Tax=Hyalangium gracile TaxID=394092 RepID=UPI001CCEEAD3|nr:hypothetical protein [Hyalangium gracile]
MEAKQDKSITDVTLTQVRDTLRQLGTDVNKNHYRIGQYYNLVVDKKMAAMGGFKNAQEFFSKEVKEISQSVLSTCGTVARAFSEQAAARHSVYHLYALITYGKAASLKLSADDPGPTLIDVPKADGTLEQKPFSECTVEELKEATRHKRPKTQPSLPEEVLARIQTLRDSITFRFPEETSHTRFNMRVIDEKTYVTVKDVLLDDLELLTEALMDGLTTVRSAA